ncbi:formate-dependent phosphoribosylglycinamide formyltransferase [Gordonia sp. NPDC003424]
MTSESQSAAESRSAARPQSAAPPPSAPPQGAMPTRVVGPPAHLGTPLTRTATTVMVLGAGELGKEVIIAFQRLGVEVIAVDRYENAPGHQVAHHAEVVDMTDADALMALVEKYRPNYIVPEIEAIATPALVEVERRGLAEVIPTARAVVTTMNREGIRRLADEELGLPTSPYLFASTPEELEIAATQIGFPCVVKPVMSSSGKGQTVVRVPADIGTAWENASSGARVAGDRVIVEGFIEFDYEITLLTVRSVDPATGRLVTHFCAPIGHQQVGGDYVESWQPHEMSTDALGAATSIAARIATALGDGRLGGRGIFGVELFVRGDDVYFSEVSPRPHDTGLVTLATQRLSEFEMHARAILGLPVDVTLASPGASAVIYGQLDETAIGFENVAQALAVPETDIRLFGKPESFHRRRMGVITATADDVATARKRAVHAASLVNPVSGRPFEVAPTPIAPPPPPAVRPGGPGGPAGPGGPGPVLGPPPPPGPPASAPRGGAPGPYPRGPLPPRTPGRPIGPPGARPFPPPPGHRPEGPAPQGRVPQAYSAQAGAPQPRAPRQQPRTQSPPADGVDRASVD